MKVPFWRLVLCFFGLHGPEERVWHSSYVYAARRPWSKVQCLYCGRCRKIYD